MPGPASKLYAQNVVNLVTLMTAKDDEGTAAFAPDYADEILSGSCVTQDGRIVHDATREAIEGPAEPVAAPAEPATATAAEPDVPYDQEADQ
jgi:NAD(P) transhydrogenase subunit alpha